MIDDLKMATATPVSVSKDDDGTAFIPASQRPDGTWRKPRRVRDGYTPQDEVPLYESKGKQFAKNKPSYPVGMCPAVMAASQAARNSGKNPIPGLTINPADEASKAKKKKKKKPASVETGVAEVTSALQGTQLNWPGGKEGSTKSASKGVAPMPKGAAPKEAPALADPAKRVKNLKKRMREVELLEQKIASGELKAPDKDQLEKIKRKDDLREQIEELEAEIGN